MKEILHHDNQHLDAKNKILRELEENGLSSGYLTYGTAPVSRISFQDARANDLRATQIRECNVG